MKKLNKVALLFATAALATAAGAQTRVTAADGGSRVENWSNGSNELVWKNGTNELCWRDATWTPATAAAGCDGALVPPPPPFARRAVLLPALPSPRNANAPRPPFPDNQLEPSPPSSLLTHISTPPLFLD